MNNKKKAIAIVSISVYMIIVAIIIAIFINVADIMIKKQNMDYMANELAKEVGSNGIVDSEFNDLYMKLCDDIEFIPNYNIDVRKNSELSIGTEFTVELAYTEYLGGYGRYDLIPIEIKATATGITEKYWK